MESNENKNENIEENKNQIQSENSPQNPNSINQIHQISFKKPNERLKTKVINIFLFFKLLIF